MTAAIGGAIAMASGIDGIGAINDSRIDFAAGHRNVRWWRQVIVNRRRICGDYRAIVPAGFLQAPFAEKHQLVAH
jgi:hypothetical protein